MVKDQTKDRAKTTPAIMCIKILLHIFNLLYLIIGAAILGVGIWVKIELFTYVELTGLYYDKSAYVLVGVGALIVLVAFGGFMCTARDKVGLLYMYGIFILLLAILQIAAGVAGGIFSNKIDTMIIHGLQSSIKDWRNHEKAWDVVQQKLKCCGVDDPKEWVTMGNRTEIPASCYEDDQLPSSANSTAGLRTEGCHKLIIDATGEYLYIIIGVAFGFVFIQIVGAILACCLAKRTSKNNYEQIY